MTYHRRICAFTNTPISLVDPASVQLTFVDLDSEGKMIKGQIRIYDCCGDIRRRGDIDTLLTQKLSETYAFE